MSHPYPLLRHPNRLTWAVALGLLSSAALAVGQSPQGMEAIVQHGSGGPEVLRLEHLPVPQPGANQVLVQVYAAGVNPVDWKARTGNPRFGGLADPHRPGAPVATAPTSPAPAAPAAAKIPGSEMAGVIAALGRGVTQWHVGAAVYGRAPTGGYAQYVVVEADSIAPKPKRLTFAQAAGLPTAGVTAQRSLSAAGVRPGNILVIIGAAGGVGSVTMQLARAQGVEVIAVASSRHNAYLKQLGATEIVNYDKDDPTTRIHNADAVIDLVDGPAEAALSYVKPGGKVILPTGYLSREACAAARITCSEPDRQAATGAGESLAQLNKLVDAGHLTIKVEKTFPLAEAARAQELDHAGHIEGKIILVTTTAAAANH